MLLDVSDPALYPSRLAQGSVPSSSSPSPPSCGTAQAASALKHLSTTLVQTIPPTTSSSTRAVLSYHASSKSARAQSLPNWCAGGSRGDSGCSDPMGGQSAWMQVLPGKELQPQHIWGCISAR